jgi:hypothetical protein
MRRSLAVAGMLSLVPAAGWSVLAQRLEYTAALSASRGSFIFAEPTTSWVFDQGLVLAADRWRLGLNLPLVTQNSSALTYIGGMPVPTGGPDAGAVRDRTGGATIGTRRRGGSGSGAGAALLMGAPIATASASALADSGFVASPGAYTTTLGDPVLSAATELAYGARGTTRIGAQLLAKLPVATSSSGVGTGVFDYGAGLSFSAVGLRTFFFADLSHWVLGDMSDLPLRDITSGALGVGVTFGEMGRVSTLASVSGATAIVRTMDAPLSAGLSLGIAAGARRYFTVGATAGFSESAPDWSLAVGWRRSLSAR